MRYFREYSGYIYRVSWAGMVHFWCYGHHVWVRSGFPAVDLLEDDGGTFTPMRIEDLPARVTREDEDER